MESAYIYVRVSTDEQKRKGYSLVEQEERLLHHCELNRIKVRGIFREDFSAKDFNRPEWTKLIHVIRKNKQRPEENILFLKWDRFSRNIAFAYQMIDILKRLNAKAMAIDQPVDFEVPESIVMLAVYLSIPEAENTRRGRNTSDGLRRARKLGRWPGKPPVGYINQTAPDGRKYTVPKHPESDYVAWSFQQFAKGIYSISHVRRMACSNGFRCSKNNFYKLLHNPFYCGIITVPPTKTEEMQLVEAAHEPLIEKSLFETVQLMLKGKRSQLLGKQSLKSLFPLRGLLHCPWCNHKLTGSISQGRTKKYRYYHCGTSKCKGRFRADILDACYEEQLKKIYLSPTAYELFDLVLQDENVFSVKKEFESERNAILSEIDQHQYLMSKARKLLLTEKLDFDDFTEIKRENTQAITSLNHRLTDAENKLNSIQCTISDRLAPNLDIFQFYKNYDVVGKRHIISLFVPPFIDPFNKSLGPLKINDALAGIVRLNN